AAPDRDVHRQGNDAEELAGDRRAFWRPRPHDRAPCRAQDLGRAAEEHRAQPAVARARADAEGLMCMQARDCRHCQATTMGTTSCTSAGCPQLRSFFKTCSLRRRPAHRLHRQALASANCLSDTTKIRFSTAPALVYYND